MFYLVLAIICSSMINIVMRLSEGRVKGKSSMLSFNYLTCMIIAACTMGFGNMFPATEGIETTLVLGVITGLFYLLGLLMSQICIKKSGVVLSSVFGRLGGLLIPLFVSIGFFGEVPTVVQILGSVIAIVSVIAINYQKGASAAAKSASLLLFIQLIFEGASVTMSKVHNEIGNTALGDQFLLYVFTSAFVLSLILVFKNKERPGWKEMAFGAAIGIPNFFGAQFLLKALESIPAVIAYPTRGVACILLITLAGVCFFHERLKKHQWASLAAILVAVVLLNI